MKFRKKPVVIDAVQYDGTIESEKAVREFCPGIGGATIVPPCPNCGGRGQHLGVSTLEDRPGERHLACPGDWIIKGVKGEFYPCKPDIFEQTYDSVDGTKDGAK